VPTGLVPNPRRSGSFSRVFILAEENGQTLVLDPGPFDNKPALLKSYNRSYTLALQFYSIISAICFFGGFIASFFWHWWAFILGCAVSFMIYKANQRSAGQFALRALKEHEDAGGHFKALGALFSVDSSRIMGRKS
jgi:hypothetical protein